MEKHKTIVLVAGVAFVAYGAGIVKGQKMTLKALGNSATIEAMQYLAAKDSIRKYMG